jgi:Fe-S-cluster containining protein
VEEPVFDPRELTPEDEFVFACHPGVPCFNKCCYDVHLVLSPYDFLRLRRGLGLSPEEFLERYGEAYIGEVTQLPVVAVHMNPHDFACPFLTPEGCRVYPDRPSACRTYPLARFLREDPESGKRREVYRIIRETHCKGHYERRPITVRGYIEEQGLEPYLRFNDLFGEVVARRQAHAETPLTGDQLDLIFLALYDLPRFREEIRAGNLEVELPGPVEELSEEALLEAGIRFVLKEVLTFD